jgi:hypothetical protein
MVGWNIVEFGGSITAIRGKNGFIVDQMVVIWQA